MKLFSIREYEVTDQIDLIAVRNDFIDKSDDKIWTFWKAFTKGIHVNSFNVYT